MTEPIEIKSISKESLPTWLAKLDGYEIIAPVKREKYSEFAPVNDFSNLNLKLGNTVVPPKGWIFEQTKPMFEFNLEKELPEIKPMVGDGTDVEQKPVKRIILGIRPCDAQAFYTIDLTFDAEFKDPYYLAARNRSTLIGLACTDPDLNCFCTSMDYHPLENPSVDIMMVETENSYLLKVYTAKGQELLGPYPELFTEPTQEQVQKLDRECEETLQSLSRKMDTQGKPEKLGKIFEADYWESVARKCLGCGICTFLCPTCYCFDITDEPIGRQGQRVRTWDSCMFSEYTVHASGYNPRPARMNRLRNRVYHKIKYYPDQYNSFGCTGCGRCIRYCPVNIDIIDIVNGVNEVTAASAEEGRR